MKMPRRLTERQKHEIRAETIRFRALIDRVTTRALFWPR
jgi:hypothetical protein